MLEDRVNISPSQLQIFVGHDPLALHIPIHFTPYHTLLKRPNLKMNSPAVNRENCSTTTPPPPSFDPTNALPATVPFTPGIDQKLLSDTESSPDSTIFADMAPARSPKLFTEELGNTRLKGPTCLRPLTKERLAAMNPTPQTPSLPSVVSHVSKVPIRGRSNFPKCVQTTYTLGKSRLRCIFP